MIIRLKAWILRRKLVVLTGDDGVCYLTMERIDLNGKKYAHVHDRWKIGHVMLLENGRATGETKYIASWRYLK